MTRPRVLILAPTNLQTDGRILRQIDVLSEYAELSVVCRGASNNLNDVKQVVIPQNSSSTLRRTKKAWRLATLRSGLHKTLYWSQNWVREMVSECRQLGSFDVIVANDLETLPVASKVAGHARIVFDAHEFYPGQHPPKGDGHRLNLQADSLCREYLRYAQGMMTTAPEMSEHYFNTYGIYAEDIPNCPRYENITIKFRSSDEPIRLIYHGACRTGRGIEAAIDGVLSSSSQFELFLMFAGSRTPEVAIHADQAAANSSRIHLIPAVHPAKIASRISEFDIGVSTLESNALNHHLTTANKFFEAIQARLAVISGPQRAVQRLTKELNVGWSLEHVTAEAFAKTLAETNHKQITEFKTNADRAARDVCLEAYAPKILKTVLPDIFTSHQHPPQTIHNRSA